jgi:protein farnesyltransferase subunit beta
MQQASACEGGGFRGRTNKLVDGCYGWWVGGLFAVLEGLVRPEGVGAGAGAGDGEWEDIEGKGMCNYFFQVKISLTMYSDMLFNRIALQEYILIVAQSPKGGLADKPGK